MPVHSVDNCLNWLVGHAMRGLCPQLITSNRVRYQSQGFQEVPVSARDTRHQSPGCRWERLVSPQGTLPLQRLQPASDIPDREKWPYLQKGALTPDPWGRGSPLHPVMVLLGIKLKGTPPPTLEMMLSGYTLSTGGGLPWSFWLNSLQMLFKLSLPLEQFPSDFSLND